MAEEKQSQRHSLSQQCEAKSRRSGHRCKRRVIAGNVCDIHGGKAAQVKAKRERTIALWEAQQSQPQLVLERREPERVLLDLLHDADVTLQKLKGELATAGVSGPLFGAFGDWSDRVGRLANLCLDSNLRDSLAARLNVLTKAQSETLIQILTAIFSDHRVAVLEDSAAQIIVDCMDQVDRQQSAAAA